MNAVGRNTVSSERLRSLVERLELASGFGATYSRNAGHGAICRVAASVRVTNLRYLNNLPSAPDLLSRCGDGSINVW